MTRMNTACRRILVVVVAMLAGVGLWEIARGTVLWAQGVPWVGDETPIEGAVFACYRMDDSDDSRHFEATVKIQNVFEESVVRVKGDDHSLLCVPTPAALVSKKTEDRHHRK